MFSSELGLERWFCVFHSLLRADFDTSTPTSVLGGFWDPYICLSPQSGKFNPLFYLFIHILKILKKEGNDLLKECLRLPRLGHHRFFHLQHVHVNSPIPIPPHFSFQNLIPRRTITLGSIFIRIFIARGKHPAQLRDIYLASQTGSRFQMGSWRDDDLFLCDAARCRRFISAAGIRWLWRESMKLKCITWGEMGLIIFIQWNFFVIGYFYAEKTVLVSSTNLPRSDRAFKSTIWRITMHIIVIWRIFGMRGRHLLPNVDNKSINQFSVSSWTKWQRVRNSQKSMSALVKLLSLSLLCASVSPSTGGKLNGLIVNRLLLTVKAKSLFVSPLPPPPLSWKIGNRWILIIPWGSSSWAVAAPDVEDEPVSLEWGNGANSKTPSERISIQQTSPVERG